jgi:hypothetical protein
MFVVSRETSLPERRNQGCRRSGFFSSQPYPLNQLLRNATIAASRVGCHWASTKSSQVIFTKEIASHAHTRN